MLKSLWIKHPQALFGSETESLFWNERYTVLVVTRPGKLIRKHTLLDLFDRFAQQCWWVFFHQLCLFWFHNGSPWRYPYRHSWPVDEHRWIQVEWVPKSWMCWLPLGPSSQSKSIFPRLTKRRQYHTRNCHWGQYPCIGDWSMTQTSNSWVDAGQRRFCSHSLLYPLKFVLLTS